MAPNIKVARAYKAMKAFGYSTETIKPVLKNLLNLYDQNWELIEDDQYKVLLDAIIESEECKGAKKKEQRSLSLEEPKENEVDTKFARAYEIMRTLGYSHQTVEPVLKKLLDLYNQNWQHIEEQQYRVLLDAILEKQEIKGEKKKPEKSCITDKNVEERRRYALRGSTLHPSPSFSEAASKPLESLADSACDHHGDNGAEAKALSPLKNHQQAERVQNDYSPLERTQKLELQPDENCDESEIPVILFVDENGSVVPKKVTDNEIDEIRPAAASWEENDVKHRSNSSKPKSLCHAVATSKPEQSPDDHTELQVPLAVVPPDHSGLLYDGNSSKDYSSNLKEAFLRSSEVILPVGEDKSACSLSGEDVSANGVGFGTGGHHLKCKFLDSAEEKNHSVDPLQLDIASSSNEAVKISIIHKSFLGSNFCIPSLDAVLRQMKEDCLLSYGIRQPAFCLTKFMKDLCECYLAAGTITTDDKRTSPTNLESGLDTPKKFDCQDVSNGSINHVKDLCIASNISLEALKDQSLVKDAPQIPRFQDLNVSDFTRCNINLSLSGVVGENCLNFRAPANLNPSSSSMMIVQKQNFSHDMLSSTYYIEDITREEEEEKVSLINEINNDRQPNFKYIPRNIVYQDAYVKFPLARISDENCCSNCFGDCLSSEIPCICASETGGDFAYSPRGIVKEKFLKDCILINRSPQEKNLFYCEECPLARSKNKSLSGKCKGHLLRKFIKECWYKCGCGMECGNRVVQRGIKVKLQVFMTSEGKGWGLRTLEDLPKGAFVCEYVGEVVTNMELFDRNMRNIGEKHTYPVLLDADWGAEGILKDEEALCLDATLYGNVARFINHRCDDANLVEIPVEVESPDHHYYHLAFFTTRKVNALEELTWDYGIDFDDDTHPVKAFQCCCGSLFCRDMKPLKRRRTKR